MIEPIRQIAVALSCSKPHGLGTYPCCLSVRGLLREVQAAEEGLEAGVGAQGVEALLHFAQNQSAVFLTPSAAAHCTMSVTVVECWSDPDVPVIVMLNVPVGVPGLGGGGDGVVSPPPPQAT